MTKTLAIYSARDVMQAEFLVQVLASHEIEAQVVGAALSTLIGYVPASMVKVHVAEADADRARAVVDEFERSGRGGARRGGTEAEASPWTCANCGETIEPQFTECWNCQLPRGAPAIGAPPANGAAERLPPDPHIGIDLPCVRCAYNLRNLPVDRVCPECAHPAFASLVQAMQSQQEWLLENEPALRPCFDYIEALCGGFRIEAIAFVAHTWPLARQRSGDAANETEIADAVFDLALEFFGDPLTATRTMQLWKLTTAAQIRRLKERLAQLGFV
jgi:hypothetical protein